MEKDVEKEEEKEDDESDVVVKDDI